MPETPENPRLRPVEAFPARLEDRDVVCLRDPSGLSNSVLTVPRALAPILALFDGLRSLVDVQAQIMRECGELVLRSQLESMVEILDQHLFLEGPRVEAERARQKAAFLEANPNHKKEFQRLKGLGEMDWDELGETTMDPEKRTLLQVSVEAAAVADEVFSKLMGNDAEQRKLFIQTNAKDVRFLDI